MREKTRPAGLGDNRKCACAALPWGPEAPEADFSAPRTQQRPAPSPRAPSRPFPRRRKSPHPDSEAAGTASPSISTSTSSAAMLVSLDPLHRSSREIAREVTGGGVAKRRSARGSGRGAWSSGERRGQTSPAELKPWSRPLERRGVAKS